MKITKRQLQRILREYHPRPDDDYDPLNPDDEFDHESPEDEAEYNRGYDDGFNGYPQNPAGGPGYYGGYEDGENDAKDPDSEASIEYAEEFGPGSPGMMGPPRREGKIRLTKRQLRRIIKEEGYYSKLPKWHIDGQPWPGSIEDLASHQGRTWGHGEVVDQKGFKGQVQKSKRLATGKDGTPLRVTETQLRRIIREEQTGVTKKYDDDSALVGDQSKLKDALQKAIIDKTVEDREEAKEKEAKEKSESIRITKTQLRRIIREAIDVVDPDTGEVFLEFGEDGFAPDAAWPELQRRLNIQPEPPPPGRGSDEGTVWVSGDDRTRLEDETVGKRGARASDARAKKLNIDNILARVDQWGATAAADFLADNPGADIGGVAPDLARSIEHEFDNDEWNELAWHFDDMAWEIGPDEDGTDMLYDYVVGAIVG